MIAEELKTQLEEKTLRCVLCKGLLETFWQKRQNLWCVLHARPANCKANFLEFSRSDKKEEGGTPSQAEERCRERVRLYEEKLKQKQIT